MTWAEILHDVFFVTEVAAIAYFAFANTFYAVTMVLATIEVRRAIQEARDQDTHLILGSHAAPTISILAPAYNEAETVVESVRSLLGLHYSELQVIVVNDGSKDDTMARLRSAFRLEPATRVYDPDIDTKAVRGIYRSPSHPDLLVIDKENGGKADALNAGLNLATSDLVCAIDTDTVITPDALLRMVRPFLRDPELLAAGGTIRIINACTVEEGWVREARVPRRPLAGFQTVEYLRAFLYGRMGLNLMGGNLVISGAFGLFRRDAVLESGGYSHGSIGEDMELIMRMRRIGRERHGSDRVVSIPDPVAWTEVPSDVRTLGNQRSRWQQGLAESLWRHKRMMFNPRYGLTGTVVFPYFAIVELTAPIIEVIGLATLVVGHFYGNLDLQFAVYFLAFAYLYGLLLTVITILLDEFSFNMYPTIRDRLLIIFWATLENFGYRQLTVWWRIRGLYRWLTRTGKWGDMQRTGFRASGRPAKR